MSPRVDHLGLDLLLVLDRGSVRPLRDQIEDQLRDGIRRGRLHAGTALPSSRALAAELGVSRGVVVDAYGQLAAEGFLVARSGAATRVAAVARHEPAAPPDERVPPPVRFDLRIEAADLSAFPRRSWQAALREVLRDAPDAAFGYGDRAGHPALRAVLASYLGRARGVAAEPERIVVTTGITQAVALLGRALRGAGVRRIAVEDPGFPVHRMVLRRQGLELAPVPVDGGGIRVDAVEASGAQAVLVTPAHQFPLGMGLAPERRTALLDWAAARDGFVLEDDYDGEYRFDREPVGALQALAPARVIYLGSASKTLAPAVRLGWAVLPGALAEAVAEEKMLADGGSPQLDQLALARFVERGELDRHLRRMRLRYRRRRDTLVAALALELPELEAEGLPAGLHLTARLPRDLRLAPRLERAWVTGIGVYGFPHGGVERLLLGYANLPEPSVAAAARALAECVAAVRS